MLDGYWGQFRAFLTVIGLMMLHSSVPLAADGLRLFTIGAGDVGGSYYASAQAICEVVNRAERGRLRCSPDPTRGAIYNLDALRKRQIDFAVVQSDWHREAFEGTGIYAQSGRFEDLRSVLSLYEEPITILARPGTGINQPTDLVGKRIDIGHPASGRRATIERFFGALALTPEKFAKVVELSSSGALDELCAGALDATILVVGHPNATIGRILATCATDLIPVAGAELTSVLEGQPDYSRAVIRKSDYPELSADVPTFAVMATLVTRADIEADIVQSLVRHVLDGRAGLAQRAPVLNDLAPGRMWRQGLTAPLHAGAKAAFAEASVVEVADLKDAELKVQGRLVLGRTEGLSFSSRLPAPFPRNLISGQQRLRVFSGTGKALVCWTPYWNEHVYTRMTGESIDASLFE